MSSFAVGDIVLVNGKNTGTVRYVGEVKSQEGTMIGVELDDKGAGESDGSVEGTRYFECQDKQGVFVKPEACAKAAAFSKDQRVRIFNHNATIRFVGETKFAEGSWVGLEFDEPVGSCDGTKGGESYFKCEPKHGLFLEAPMIDLMDVRRSVGPAVLAGKRASQVTAQKSTPLQEGLQKKASTLKPTTTKELIESEAADIAAAGKLFTENEGDLTKLAGLTGGDLELMQKTPPKDAEDFGKHLLMGSYTVDKSEMAKKKFRQDLYAKLERKRSSLKKSTTKEMTGEASDAEIQIVAAIFTQNDADLDKIATQCGIDVKLLRHDTPLDAKDFARKLLAGKYSTEKGEAAKADLRNKLSHELHRQASLLRRTSTRESLGEPSAEDVQALASAFIDNARDLDRLARVFGASISLLRANKPTSPEDFAKKMLAGEYTGDKGSMAKTELRKRLREDLKSQKSTLKRTSTKEGGGPSDVELAVCAKLYNDRSGDLAKIAEDCGLDLAVLQQSPPPNAEEFAKNLLAGTYLADSAESAKKQLRQKLAENITTQRASLKRTSTNESLARSLSKIELTFVEKIYESSDGDLESVAKQLSLPLVALQGKPPKDAKDFAKNFYDGLYTQDLTEVAKKELRQHLRQDLLGQIGRLKPAIVKETNRHASHADIDSIAEIFRRHRGNHEEMARQFGASVKVLEANPPKDGQEFAKKLLDGFYTGDSSEIQKAALRSKLREELVHHKAQARKSVALHTPEGGGGGRQSQRGLSKPLPSPRASRKSVSDHDLKKIAEFYDSVEGDLKKLETALELNPALVAANKPTDAQDFARKLLEGTFTGEVSELQRSLFRQKLLVKLTEAQGKLKRTSTKESMGVPSMEDLAFVAQHYDKVEGNLANLAKRLNLDVKIVEASAPKDGHDFAQRLLRGDYSVDKEAVKKDDFRKQLRDALTRQSSKLKRATTKEAMEGVSEEDIQAIAKVYSSHRANLKSLATAFNIDAAVLQKYPPNDPKVFAKNLFKGMYSTDGTAVKIADLRANLAPELKKQSSQLKKTTTKEVTMSDASSPHDLACAAKIYYDAGGDLEKIAPLIDITVETLKETPPTGAMDFAQKLLSGNYTLDKDDAAKSTWRQNLRLDIFATKSKLKRTSTKENVVVEPNDKEKQAIKELYADAQGDLEKLAHTFSLSLPLLQQGPPEDEVDFLKKLFEGIWLADKDLERLSEFRNGLLRHVRDKRRNLQRVMTREGAQMAPQEDVDRFAQVYKSVRGDLPQLAMMFGQSIDIMEEFPPEDCWDFARRLLHGDYSAKKEDVVRHHMFASLRQELHYAADSLKHTEQNEPNLGITASDLQTISTVYTNLEGDADKLADHYEIAASKVRENPPKSGLDFAGKLLDGAYSLDESEMAKASFRDALLSGLMTERSKLKRAITKVATGHPSPEEIDFLVHLYESNNGDLDALAEICGFTRSSMTQPASPKEFAEKALAGAYVADETEVNKKNFRVELRGKLQKQRSDLKKSHTKVMTGDADPEDVAALIDIFAEERGHYPTLCSRFGANIELMRVYPPVDGRDFAKKLLAGFYTGDVSLLAREQLRSRLKKDIGVTKHSLRRTETKVGDGKPTAEDMKAVADVYVKMFDAKSDPTSALKELAQTFGVDEKLVLEHRPNNADEFAKSLLEGTYLGDKRAQNEEEFRSQLKGEIRRVKSVLKKTHTKSWAGPSEDEMNFFADSFTKNEGDLEKLAEIYNVSKDLILKDPPDNARDFATKLLAGNWTPDGDLAAKAEFRDQLLRNIRNKKNALVPQVTRIGGVEVDRDTIDSIVAIYKKQRGIPDALAKAFGANLSLIEKYPPANGEDFARKMLDGVYAGEEAELAKDQFRQNLHADIRTRLNDLKHVDQPETSKGIYELDIEAIASFYNLKNGNLEEIGQIYGIELSVLEANPPDDAEDFAKKLLTGVWAVDQKEVARQEMRDSLEDSLPEAASKLKSAVTKIQGYQFTAGELARIAQIWQHAADSMEDLARLCGISVKLLHADAPKDAKDFATKLFAGAYTEDLTESRKKELRSRLNITLQKQHSLLKRTQTKEAGNAPMQGDVDAFAKEYSRQKGNLESLAAQFQFDLELATKNPPSSPEDFGAKLLSGAYTGEKTAIATKLLREDLLNNLQFAVLQLHHTGPPPELPHIDDEAIKVVGILYEQHAANADKLASMFGVSADLIRQKAPADANVFAQQLLDGAFTVDESEVAKIALRGRLKEGLEPIVSNLKRTTTKEGFGEPKPEDVEQIAQIYVKLEGAPDALASYFSFPAKLLTENPPTDGADFATKLLAGSYVVDESEQAKYSFRIKLRAELNSKKGVLQKTTTKEMVGDASPEDLAAVAKIFGEKRGNVEGLAHTFGVQAALISQHAPQDGREFAKMLLAGFFTGDSTAEAKKVLRTRLQADIKNVRLKRVATKEGVDVPPTEAEIEAVEKVWTDHKGDLPALAHYYTLDLDKLEKAAPADGKTFATQLIAGEYHNAAAEDQKARIRSLVAQATSKGAVLKRVETREMPAVLKEEDLDPVLLKKHTEDYNEAEGNLAQLAADKGLDAQLLLEDAPKTDEEFAKRLLLGYYTKP